MGDGDLDWKRWWGHLRGRFTCYLPNWRGRGLSGDHPDLNFGVPGERRVTPPHLYD